MATKTIYAGLNVPDIDSDEDTWGSLLNDNWNLLDNYLNEIIQSRSGFAVLQDKIASIDNNIGSLQTAISSAAGFTTLSDLAEAIALIAGYNRDCICEVPSGAIFGVNAGNIEVNGIICNFSKKIIRIDSLLSLAVAGSDRIIVLQFDPSATTNPVQLTSISISGSWDPFISADQFGKVGSIYQIPIGEVISGNFYPYFINRELIQVFDTAIDLSSSDYLENQWITSSGPGTYPKKLDLFIKVHKSVPTDPYVWIKADNQVMVPSVSRTQINFTAINQNWIPGNTGKGVFVKWNGTSYDFYTYISKGILFVRT